MDGEAGRRPVVLVLEDEAHIRELICLHLGLEPLDCVEAAAVTGAESSLRSG